MNLAAEKLEDITHLSSWAILLVVFGHSYPDLQYSNDILVNALLWARKYLIYSYHMPLFMFIAGYLFIHTSRDRDINYVSFVQKKFKRLLVPYFVISTCVFPVKTFLSQYADRPVQFNLNDYVMSVIYPDDNVIALFWFLPTLFIIFLIAPIFKRYLVDRKIGILCLMSVLFIILNLFNPVKNIKLLSLNCVASMIVFFWMGCVFYMYRIKFGFIPVILIFMLFVSYGSTYGNAKVALLLTASSGIFLSYEIIQRYSSNNCHFLKFIDGYSYQIFLLSWFPQNLIKIILYKNLNVGFIVTFLSMFLGGIIIPVMASKFIRRHAPSLKFVIGLQ